MSSSICFGHDLPATGGPAHVCSLLCTTSTCCAGLLPAGTVTEHGTIVRSTLTAYEVEGGAFVPFAKVHGTPPMAEPLVAFG